MCVCVCLGWGDQCTVFIPSATLNINNICPPLSQSNSRGHGRPANSTGSTGTTDSTPATPGTTEAERGAMASEGAGPDPPRAHQSSKRVTETTEATVKSRAESESPHLHSA